MELQGKKIALCIEDNYQELECWYPYYRLKEAGAEVVVIGPEKKAYKSKLGYPIEADYAANQVINEAFDGIIIPGGYAPDLMRTCKELLQLIKRLHDEKKMIAAICHGIWVLVSAKIMSNKKATCYHSIKDDLINAGGLYHDKPVVVDENIITSRKPDDLPYFLTEIIKRLNEK